MDLFPRRPARRRPGALSLWPFAKRINRVLTTDRLPSGCSLYDCWHCDGTLLSWRNALSLSAGLQGYKVYYTTAPNQPLSRWESQFVDNNKLTTISELTPHTIYTIRVEAYTAIGPGPPSLPVQVKTQHGVPSQPSRLRVLEARATSVKLAWEQPAHSGENVVSYELYWNDTYTDEVGQRLNASRAVSLTFARPFSSPTTGRCR